MTDLKTEIEMIISAYIGCKSETTEKCAEEIVSIIGNKVRIAEEIASLNNTLAMFRDDYRTAHSMNYEGGGGMFGGLFGRKK